MQSSSASPKLPLHVVEPLCASFAKQADWILRLYEMTRGERQHPGQCVRCFYELLGAAKGEKRQALQPLRDWIEENLEVAASAGASEAGSWPVLLDEPDLASFCEKAMRRVREDAVIANEQVSLRFSFKRGDRAA